MTLIYEEIKKINFQLEEKNKELLLLGLDTFELKPEVLELCDEIQKLNRKKKQLEDKLDEHE